jgi:threonine dehydrogenase-like Zn-dependent dehydrogenase
VTGSDLHLPGGYIPAMRAGDVLGHELMGTVTEVGSESDAAPTGWSGADQAEVRPGDVVGVWGAGGVGQMAARAIYACRKGGTVFTLGVFAGLVDKFPLGAVMNKGLTLRGAQQHGTATSPASSRGCATARSNRASRHPRAAARRGALRYSITFRTLKAHRADG